jgi:HPt (histidine-containing phosphotransfer) domain-containing protein
MVELVQFFVDEIDDRITTIRTTAQTDDITGLRTVAHQLKGAATGYGFEPISQTAGELERLIDETDALEVTGAIQQQVDALIELCRRAST